MNFLNKPNDNFFYFFGIYSVLFLFFDFINSLAIFEVITYLGFIGFFAYRLYDYYNFVREHKPRIKSLAIGKSQKELSSLVHEAEENTREGTIIILITLSVFIAFFLLGREGKQDISQVPTFAGADFLAAEKLKTQNIPTQIIEENEEEIISLDSGEQDNGDDLKTNTEEVVNNDEATENQKETNNEDILLEPTEELEVNKPEEKEEEPKVEAEEVTEDTEKKEVIRPKEIPGNLTKESNDVGLAVGKNFSYQVKDVYNLQPFTKNGSSFTNVLQLQRVLNQLGYYSGVADGVFNFETKLAIYNTLVKECRWPAASTTGVFGSQAKACFDNLYIVVREFETEGLPE